MQANCRVENGKLINEVNSERYEYDVGDVLKVTTKCGSSLICEMDYCTDEEVWVLTSFSSNRFFQLEIALSKIVDIIPVRRG